MMLEGISCRRHILPFFLAVSAMVSCGTVEVDRPSDFGGLLPEDGPGGAQEIARELYVTGVEYPAGYDWHTDPEYGQVACTLFLMKGDERILELAVGESNMISADPDMHRCFGGHLYTDFSTETETIVMKDGTELFRYPDREMICGFQVSGDDIYTLGTPRDGDGWTLRKNGVVTMVKTTGYPMTDLRLDGDDIWFAYADPIIYGGGEIRRRCYLVVDGKASPVGAEDDIETVDDILLYGGKTYFTAKLQGMSGHVLYCGEEMHAVELGPATVTKDCRVHYDGGKDIYVTGLKYLESIGYVETMWKNYSVGFNYSSGSEVRYYLDGDMMNYVLTYDADGVRKTRIFKDCVDVYIGAAEQEYIFLGPSAACAGDGHFHVALHPADTGTGPALFSDSMVTVYDFNGYFTTVSLW